MKRGTRFIWSFKAFDAFSSEGALNRLAQLFGLKEDERSLLKELRLSVALNAKGFNFSPALALDPVLGKKDSFGAAFPNLEQLNDTFQKEVFSSLGNSLQEFVIQQPKGELEVFGAKIPSELIAIFGLPTLAIFLFQFSVVGFYTASNTEALGQEEASEWSFLLSGWPFLFMGLACLAFPAAVSIWTLFFVVWGDLWPNLGYLALVLVVLICDIRAFCALLRLRTRVAAEPTAPASRKRAEVDYLAD